LVILTVLLWNFDGFNDESEPIPTSPQPADDFIDEPVTPGDYVN